MVRSLEEIQREKARKGPKVLRLYLVAAAFFMGLAIAAYVFETEIQYCRCGRDELFAMNKDELRFLLTLTIPILMALFCLYCYRVPRVGLKLLGYAVELRDEGEDDGAPPANSKTRFAFSAKRSANTRTCR